MTEEEWLGGGDPVPMLNGMQVWTDRKLRLFVLACCRRVWDLIPREQDREVSRRALLTAERFADGEAGPEELEAAAAQVFNPDDPLQHQAGIYAHLFIHNPPRAIALRIVEGAADMRANDTILASLAAEFTTAQGARFAANLTEYAAQAALLREVFGNPFRPVHVSPDWLRWNGGVVATLAQTMYDQRRFDAMPVLADALEEAGCTDAALLGHCRSGQEHVLGCWALDLLLNKK